MRSPRRARYLSACLGVIAAVHLAAPRVASAQTAGPSDAVAAEALFDEGRRLATAGKYAEACPKFAESQRLDPSPGTQLNLASCWEKLGRTASAWATYRAAASAAAASGRKEYVSIAQKHAEALAPKLARLTVVAPTGPGTDGIEIKRDGAVVPPGEYGVGIPVDLGSHTIEASGKGFKPWSKAAEVAEGGALTITIPPLDPAPATEAPSTALPVAPPIPALPAPPPAPGAGADVGPAPAGSGAGRTMRVTGVVVGAVGVGGLVTAGVLAGLAKGKYNQSLNQCEPNAPNMCMTGGVSERDTARGLGNGATVAVIAGGVVAAAGVVLWLVAPREAAGAPTGRTSLWVAPSPAGAALGGAF